MFRSLLISSFLILNSYLAASAETASARLTQLVHEVSVLPADAPARRAVLNETVAETNGLKTGGNSRAELTFADQTITRLGSNTLYSFKNAGRRGDLNTGSTLLRIPKDSRGAAIYSSAVTVAVTGTTVIFEQIRGGAARLTVLEGTARLTLVRSRDERTVAAGQSLEVPAGAARLPEPKQVDLAALMKTSPLIVGFRALPSQNLINNAIRQQQQQRGPQNQNQRSGPQGPQSPKSNAPPPPPGPR